MRMIKNDFNWGIILIGFMSVGIWYSIFTNGFFVTFMWLIIISAVIGLWIRLTGRG